ncbi:MAG: alpha/beta hydrolase [Anaerosomatales bacterium]|nr:alpha/beta hydrolase [Anaerosomatales bacterium]
MDHAATPEAPPDPSVAAPPRHGRARRLIAWVLLGLLAALLFVPLLWPVPEVPGAVEPRELAGPDSLFVEVGGVEHHYVRSGTGGRVVIFLHGFGASTFSWRDTLPDIAARATAIAFDRPGFGLTERKLRGEWEGPNPYSPTTQADNVIGLMDELGISQAVLVGHSAGGTIAVLAAARHPERVSGLVLEAPAIYTEGGAPRFVRPLLATPQARRIGPLIVRRALAGDTGERLVRAAWADPSAVTDEVIEGYRAPLAIRDWDRALWELTIAPRPDRAADALDSIECPVLVVAGTEDGTVPYADSARVAEVLGARLATFEDTGHIPHEERPERFATELFRFLDELDPACQS